MATNVVAPTPTPQAALPRARGRDRWSLPPVVSFLARRLAAGILTILVVSALAFACTNLLPGDVASLVLGRHATPATLEHLRHEIGTDRPLTAQYVSWLWGVLHLDFGKSAVASAQLAANPSISATLGHPLVNSIILAGITALLLIPLTLILGAIAGVRAGRMIDHGISGPSLVLGGLPEFITGTILIYIFFTVLNVLPPTSSVAPGDSPLDHLDRLVLPVLTLLIVTLGSGVRQVRAGTIQALHTDFVLFARLNGVAESRVITHYAIRNAMATSVQTLAQNLQYLAGGIIIVEALFGYPGIGVYLLNAVLTRDTNEVLAASIILATFYTAINIAADLLVVFLVPKLRTELE